MKCIAFPVPKQLNIFHFVCLKLPAEAEAVCLRLWVSEPKSKYEYISQFCPL